MDLSSLGARDDRIGIGKPGKWLNVGALSDAIFIRNNKAYNGSACAHTFLTQETLVPCDKTCSLYCFLR
jgi:hypothetical protein